MQGWESVKTLYQSENPNPTQPTNGIKKKNTKDKREKADQAIKKTLIPLYIAYQSSNVKHKVNKIVP